MGRGKVEMNYGDNSVEDNETSADDDDDLRSVRQQEVL